MARPQEIVLLEDINTKLQRLNERVAKLIELEEKNLQGLNKIEQSIMAGYPEGAIIPQTVEVTGEKVLDFTDEPLYTFSLFNDGTGDIYVGVNAYPIEQVPIKEKESYICPIAKRGSIQKIILVCPRGSTATVRIYAAR